MIYKKYNIPKLNIKENNFYVVMDFDKTLTTSDSYSSYEIIFDNRMMNEEFYNESKLINDKYEAMELDPSIDKESKAELMREWLEKSMQLLIKYNISEETINSLVKSETIQLRKGAKAFLELMQIHNIEVIIISAGIENVIKSFLKENGILFNNITIISNYFQFKYNKVNLKGDVIFSENKDEIRLPIKIKERIKDKNNIVLLGDRIDDIKMIENPIYNYNNAIKIGFLDNNIEDNLNTYKNKFDYVLTNNASYNEVSNYLGIFD